MRIYRIPESNLPDLELRLEKINKTARKLKVPEITTQFHGVQMIKKDHKDIEVYLFSFDGSSPKIAGWSFVGKVESTEAGNALRSFKGEEVPESYRGETIRCDHCESKRKRNFTYIVRHEDGRLFQVGKNCLKDFLGHTNLDHIFTVAEMFLSFDELERADYESSHERLRVETSEYLGFVFQSISDGGYKTKNSSSPTSYDAWKRVSIPNKDGKYETLLVENKEKALVAIEWIKNKQADGSFELNMQTYAKLPYLNQKQIGIAAYIAAAYLKNIGEEIYKKKEDKPDQGFFGNIGERYELNLQVTSESVVDSQSKFHSETYVYRFVDDGGKEFTMFASYKRYDIGESIKIRATVVKHQTYKGRSQTIINRPKSQDETPEK